MALSFPDDFPFNRRSREPEAQMEPQSQVQQSQGQSQAPSQAPVEAQRVRPAVPEGARASAVAMKAIPPMPQPPQMMAPTPDDAIAEERVNAPGDARSMVTRSPAALAQSQVNAVYPRAQERRRSPRQTLVAKAVVRSEFNQNTVATGFLSNISMLGVGFHTRRPLSIGEKFQMRLELGPMKWATRLRVVSCAPHDSGTYDIGAEFIGSDLVDRVQRELAA